jgi:hypothetical protein
MMNGPELLQLLNATPVSMGWGWLVPVAGAALGLLGKKKSQDAATKAKQEEERLKYEAAQKAHAVREKARIASLQGLQASSVARGIKGAAEAVTPEMLLTREFTGVEPSKETGSSFLGDVFSAGGEALMGAYDLRQQEKARESREAEFKKLLCALNPGSPDCPKAQEEGPMPLSDIYEGGDEDYKWTGE